MNTLCRYVDIAYQRMHHHHRHHHHHDHHHHFVSKHLNSEKVKTSFLYELRINLRAQFTMLFVFAYMSEWLSGFGRNMI